jgi:tetratricopeptide (TPR) repeat protein
VYVRARKGARSLRDAYDVATLRQRLVDAYANTGRLYRGQKDLREAELSFERAAALDPKHVESRQALVSLYRKSGRTADAIRVLEQLTEIAPSLVDYPLEVGCLYLELGQTEQAEAALRKACARDAKSAASRVALVGLYLKTVHPTEGYLGLKDGGHADSLWSFGKRLQKEKPACPRAYCTMPLGCEATIT